MNKITFRYLLCALAFLGLVSGFAFFGIIEIKTQLDRTNQRVEKLEARSGEVVARDPWAQWNRDEQLLKVRREVEDSIATSSWREPKTETDKPCCGGAP